MEIKQGTYRYFFVVGIITYIAAITLFLLSFNAGYKSYISCIASITNTTKATTKLNSTLIPQQQGNLNIPAKDKLYYECGWHWTFSPTLAHTFELAFGAGSIALLAVALAVGVLWKGKTKLQ